eukprot:Phypoly_transcript_03055.p1 GENE.Phypoly_transcript_03055~~Phypoly_transcript_03055.p1  ORF type:complete len:697 (+),score=161.07 Phypoly_transcript_03055:231-2321(+)
MAFWFCRSFENANQHTNRGYFSFLKLGYICIGWSSRMAELQVMNYPFVDEKDIRERLEPVLQLDAVQAGKVGDKRMISHSGEFKCFKNFFLYMKNGDSVVIRNLYSGFREYTLGIVTSDIQWSNGYELDLLQKDPSALYAIRRVKWISQGNYDDLEKDLHNNVPWFSAQLTLSKLGATTKYPYCLDELTSKAKPFEWKEERKLYIIPPEQYATYSAANAAFADGVRANMDGAGFNYEEDFGDFGDYGDYGDYEALDGSESFAQGETEEDIITSETFVFPIVPISTPITVVPFSSPSTQSPSPTLKAKTSPSLKIPSSPSTVRASTHKTQSTPSTPKTPSGPSTPKTPSSTPSTPTTPSTPNGFQIRINLKKSSDGSEKQLSTEQPTQPTQPAPPAPPAPPANNKKTTPDKKQNQNNKKAKRERADEKEQVAAVPPQNATKSLAELMANSNSMFQAKRHKACNEIYDINTSTKVLVHLDRWEPDNNLWVDVNLVRLPPTQEVGKRFFITGEVIEVQNNMNGCDDSGGWYVAVIKQKKENQMKVQYVGFDVDEDWISMDENAFPKKARKYSNAVIGGCILEPGDKIEVMWRDKVKEKEFSEPFGWFDATVLDIKDFNVDTDNKELVQIKEKQESELKALNNFLQTSSRDLKCAKCKTREVGCVLLNCMHLCACAECAASMPMCPLCQAPVQQVKPVRF